MRNRSLDSCDKNSGLFHWLFIKKGFISVIPSFTCELWTTKDTRSNLRIPVKFCGGLVLEAAFQKCFSPTVYWHVKGHFRPNVLQFFPFNSAFIDRSLTSMNTEHTHIPTHIPTHHRLQWNLQVKREEIKRPTAHQCCRAQQHDDISHDALVELCLRSVRSACQHTRRTNESSFFSNLVQLY